MPDVQPFLGFEPLQANYVYCPNQFFDVCLPHCSRGTVRIVAWILRQTLGWLDEDGNPVRQEVTVTYRELVEKAGISKGAIAPAIGEALKAGFLQRVSAGRAKSKGRAAASSSFQLRWSSADRYTKDLAEFDGFYAGEGHRSPIPNAFFDQLVRHESLAVLKVVGTVLRHTVGYQNQFGGRRTSAPLSYSFIARYAQLSQGRVLNAAVQTALERGYMICVKSGIFGTKSAEREAARYSVRWLGDGQSDGIGSKKPSMETSTEVRFKKATDIGSKTPSVDRFKKATKEKTPSKDKNKQQPAADFDRKKTIQLLVAEGFDECGAETLARRFDSERIERQITWLDLRHPNRSRTGMLRRAIEEDWPMPEKLALREKRAAIRQREARAEQRFRQEEELAAGHKRSRADRRTRLLTEWSAAHVSDRQRWLDTTVRGEPSAAIADIIRRQTPMTETPHVHVLNVIAREQGLPPVFENTERRDAEES